MQGKHFYGHLNSLISYDKLLLMKEIIQQHMCKLDVIQTTHLYQRVIDPLVQMGFNDHNYSSLLEMLDYS